MANSPRRLGFEVLHGSHYAEKRDADMAENHGRWQRHGDHQFRVLLADGRELFVVGHRFEIGTGGALIVYAKFTPADPPDDPVPAMDEYPYAVLAPGRWIECWMASIPEIERRRLTPRLLLEVLERDRYTCQKCGHSRGHGAVLHVDHVVPVSKGGKTEKHNLETLCRDCNLGKGAT